MTDLNVKQHYETFPYPTPFDSYARPVDPLFWTRFLHQDVGSHFMPAHPSIWVPGCGTRLALQTALAFPHAEVLGTDISERALEVCSADVNAMDVQNLTLSVQDLDGDPRDVLSGYYDYIICTGVLHHLQDPQNGLRMLARALKSTGMMRLMVYNRAHHQRTEAVQQLIERVSQGASDQLRLARELLLGVGPMDQGWLREFRELPDVELADAFCHPRQVSYRFHEVLTALSVEQLHIVQPYHPRGHQSWALNFRSKTLQERFEALPMEDRLETAAELLAEFGPMFDFYVAHGALSPSDHMQLDRRFAEAVKLKQFRLAATDIDTWNRVGGKLVRGMTMNFFPATVDFLHTLKHVPDLTPLELYFARVSCSTTEYPFILWEG